MWTAECFPLSARDPGSRTWRVCTNKGMRLGPWEREPELLPPTEAADRLTAMPQTRGTAGWALVRGGG